MELIDHLGLTLGSDPTNREIASKLYAMLAVMFLINILSHYHVVSMLNSFWGVFSPRQAETAKRFASSVFWQIATFLVSLNKMEVSVTGDKMTAESAIVISNHQSLADYHLMVRLAQTSDLQWQPQVNFFTWCSLWRVPTVKTILNLLFTDENWELSASLCKSIFNRVVMSNAPEWIVLFPEVNIWTESAAYLQQIQAQRYYLPEYEHVLYPRFSSLANTVDTLSADGRIKFATVYDVTVLYHGIEGAPNLLSLFASNQPIKATVHVRQLALSDIPTSRSKLEKWLEELWAEKDKQLALMKENAKLTEPTESTEPTADSTVESVDSQEPEVQTLKTADFTQKQIKDVPHDSATVS